MANKRKSPPTGKKRSSKAAAATSKIPENGKSARVPIGRTLKTQDKYLPSDRKKVQELKDRRWVVVIDKNTNEELAVVRLTTETQPNSSPLPNYRHGNKKETRFKHFVETEDDEGNAIRVDGKKFLQNLKKYDLNEDQIKTIQNKVYHRVKQSQTNNEKIKRLKSRDPKKEK